MNSHSDTSPAMSAEQARQIGRHAKAALLHLVAADRLAEDAGLNLLADDGGWCGFVTGGGSGPARAFRAALDAAEQLDEWAIGNAHVCGAGTVTYGGTERWCHSKGGVLPTGRDAAGPVTPARMRVIAEVAEDRVRLIERASADFRAQGQYLAGPVDDRTEGDLVRLAGFRLPEAAGYARQVAREMRETAVGLERIAAVPADACRIPWPVCPEHGSTIAATGGTSWCRVSGCGRRWDYDRGDVPCPEPVRWRVTDQEGDGGLMCDGHALAARTLLVGGSVVPLDKTGGTQP
ncbi:hypothetical protein OHR68_09090 [Spirillospora sp. NBC_00431]